MIKNERVPRAYHMYFDVSSLFITVLLDCTVDVTLKIIYGDKKIETEISRKSIKRLLLLCTKNFHFTFGI